jgi:3-hydroxyacyl-[acyl-carrier-protein] dehydratase
VSVGITSGSAFAPADPGFFWPVPMRGLDSWSTEPAVGGGFVLRAGMAVRADEPALRGHFPGFTVYPGVFVLETLAQSVSLATDAPARVRLVRSIRFLRPLLGGMSFRLRAEVSVPAEGAWRARGVVEVEGGQPAVRFDVELRGGSSCP